MGLYDFNLLVYPLFYVTPNLDFDLITLIHLLIGRKHNIKEQPELDIEYQ